ncbi:hypothetical protein C8J56DRAFT_1114320, partial [Mycena floridula]
TEHRNPEGRTYWFNTSTRDSVWEKPDELKSPFERALNQTKWKEYFSGGRKYYYNTETKESKWDMPDELLLVLEKVEKETQAAQAAAAVPRAITAPGFTPVGSADANPTTNGNADLQVGAHTGGIPTPSAIPSRPNLPEDPVVPHNGFLTFEEGEKAFMHLLRKAGVSPTWTWEQTMRAIITDPLYKALNSLSDKKATFEKYVLGLKAKEQEEKEARLNKLRPAIRNMLKGNPNVFHYTTFTTADKLFSMHPIWQQARIEAERKLIFEEYVGDLKQREIQESRAARTRGVSKLMTLFSRLEVDVLTRWRTAHNLILESDEWNSDAELQKLPTLDLLLAFEDYSRVREREFEDQQRRAQVEKTRKERKAREAFKALLHELIQAGHIKARTKWKEVYPLFSDDSRYLDMLGNPGSNQLELFWDAVDALDQKLDVKLAVVQDAIKKYNDSKGHSASTEGDESFLSVLKESGSSDVEKFSKDELHIIYITVTLKKQADEKRRAERKLRHQMDDLRYALKKLPEPLDLALTFEEAMPLIENLPEYKILEHEESRRTAFAKFVKKQKERLREATGSEDGSNTSRKRKEPLREDRRSERESHRKDSRHYRHDDYEHGYKSSRDYRDKDDKERDRDYRSSRHYRDDKDDRRRERTKSDFRDWDEPPKEKERIGSLYDPPREKRESQEDKIDDRAEKVCD